MRNWLIAVVPGILAILIAAGCGGGNSRSLTKSEFIKKGDEICKEHKARLLKEVLGYAKQHGLTSKRPSGQDTRAIAEKLLIPSTEDELRELRALNPPSGDEAQVESIFTAVEEALEEVKKEPKAVFAQGAQVFSRSNRLAHQYGFQVCGSG